MWNTHKSTYRNTLKHSHTPTQSNKLTHIKALSYDVHTCIKEQTQFYWCNSHPQLNTFSQLNCNRQKIMDNKNALKYNRMMTKIGRHVVHTLTYKNTKK